MSERPTSGTGQPARDTRAKAVQLREEARQIRKNAGIPGAASVELHRSHIASLSRRNRRLTDMLKEQQTLRRDAERRLLQVRDELAAMTARLHAREMEVADLRAELLSLNQELQTYWETNGQPAPLLDRVAAVDR